MNELASDIQSMESHNSQLEDELRDALRKVDLLQAQLARVKEGVQQEAARLELDLKDTRKARNHFRQLSSVKTAEAEEGKRLVQEAKRDAEDAHKQATKWKKEVDLLRAELQKKPRQASTTHSFPSTSTSGSSRDHGSLKEELKGPLSVQPNKELRPPSGPVDVIMVSSDDDDGVGEIIPKCCKPMKSSVTRVNSQVPDAVPRTRSSNNLNDDQFPKVETKDVILKTDSSPKTKPLIKPIPETPPEPVLKCMAMEPRAYRKLNIRPGEPRDHGAVRGQPVVPSQLCALAFAPTASHPRPPTHAPALLHPHHHIHMSLPPLSPAPSCQHPPTRFTPSANMYQHPSGALVVPSPSGPAPVVSYLRPAYASALIPVLRMALS
ncbi:hypothetical protein EVG20_g9019 [Dentipellis fragilis]|uniref:Uncharacterized protein n=1 Tax=Dentipellis fragilis TaxID=205917 RepID=A0A4Y9Y353_9AGAM|nr:hypothetical protein EVG20_g9019 [Dentipellis fragilis]